MILELEDLQYEEFLDSDILIPAKGKRFRRDRHCEDVLIFPADQKEPLKCLQLVVHKYLILQVRSKCERVPIPRGHWLLCTVECNFVIIILSTQMVAVCPCFTFHYMQQVTKKDTPSAHFFGLYCCEVRFKAV